MVRNYEIADLKIILVHPCSIIRNGIGALVEKFGARDVKLYESCEAFLNQENIPAANLILMHYSQCTTPGNIEDIMQSTEAQVALLASSDTFHRDSYEDIYQRLVEGITGFLDLDEPVSTFMSELEDIAAGDIVISSKFAQNIIHKTGHVNASLDEELSQRELQILNLVAEGSTNTEIGRELHISSHTVKGHLTNILTKLNLKNRQQAVAYIMKRRQKADYVRDR